MTKALNILWWAISKTIAVTYFYLHCDLYLCSLNVIFIRHFFPNNICLLIRGLGHVVIQLHFFYWNKCCLRASLDTEMCCAKGKCWCQYFILLTLKKTISTYTGVLDYFNEKLILDYYFCLKSGPVFLFQIFIIILYSESKYNFHNPLLPPKGYSIVSLIIN